MRDLALALVVVVVVVGIRVELRVLLRLFRGDHLISSPLARPSLANHSHHKRTIALLAARRANQTDN